MILRQARCRTTRECRSGRRPRRCRRAAAAGRPAASALTPVAFSVLMTTSCGPSVGRIVGGLHVGLEFGVADPKRQAVCLHGIEMRPAHHAGDVVAGQRKPHRKMAADGARAENAYPHGVDVPAEGIGGRRRQFPQACAAAQPAMRFASPARRKGMDQSPTSPAYCPRITEARTKESSMSANPVLWDLDATRRRDGHAEPPGGQQRL